jgi:hypothetical protein
MRVIRALVHIIIWIALVIVTTLPTLVLIPPVSTPWGLFSFSPYAGAAGVLLAFRYSDSILDRIWPKKSTTLSSELLNVAPDVPLSEAQRISIAWASTNQPQRSVDAVFAAIRVSAKNGSVLGCRAELRCQKPILMSKANDPVIVNVNHEHVSGGTKVLQWEDEGYVNWYSVGTRKKIGPSIHDFSLGRLNAYLKNTREDIYEGNPKELLVFYVLHNDFVIHPCTDVEDSMFARIEFYKNEMPLRFLVQLTITGEGLARPLVQEFTVSVSQNVEIAMGTTITLEPKWH